MQSTQATLENIQSQGEAAAVALSSDIDGLSVTNCGGHSAALGVAHASGKIQLLNCTTRYSYILQEKFGSPDAVSFDIPKGDPCAAVHDVNLTRLLAVFGTEYETRYFHDGNYAMHTASRASLIFMFVAIFVAVVLTIIFTIVYVYPLVNLRQKYKEPWERRTRRSKMS